MTLVPFAQAEAIDAALRAMVPQEAFEFLVLAWHYEHLVYQAQAKHKRAQQRERARSGWRCAAGLVGDEFDTPKRLCSLGLLYWPASSLVEMVNSLIRPYLNSCKGQITQETLNLIMFYHESSALQERKTPKAPLNS